MTTVTDFDEAAATWDDDPAKAERSRIVAAAIAAAVPTGPDVSALDYGCGTGLVTWALAPHLGAVTLADSSAGMLSVVRDRLAARPDVERFTVRHLDLTTDAAPRASFDLVYTVMALHHVQDLGRVLRELRASLRPGGRIAVADLDHDPEGHFHGEDFDGHHGFDRGALAGQLRAAGFSAPRVSTVTVVTKEVRGVPRDFPLFLAVADAAS